MSPLRFHSQSAVTFASLAAVMFASVFACASAAAAPGQDPLRMADAFLVDETGDWFCPSGKVVCSEGPLGKSKEFAEWLLKPGYLKGKGRPLYLRAAKARNDCRDGNENCSDLGVPTPTQQCQPGAANTPSCALKSLKKANVKLGIVISAKRDAPRRKEADETDEAGPRDPSALAWHACQIRKADVDHLYDFMFIDLTFKLTPPQVRETVRLLKRGQIIKKNGQIANCAAGRWPRVITNDTTWKPGKYNLDTGAWGHTKRLGVIEDKDPVTSGRRLFTNIDKAFVEKVNDLGSRAVLRLEVTPDTSEFAGLPSEPQCSLLTGWAREQKSLGFTLLFPLFVHGVAKETTQPYNSLVEQTFLRQMELIADPIKKKYQTGCPELPAASPFGQPPPPAPARAGNPPHDAPPPQPAVPAAPRIPDVMSHEPTNLTCHSARLNGWVNPHGTQTTFHFVYWKRGEPSASQQTGVGDAGAGMNRVDVARVADGLQRNTGYTGRLVASNAAGRAVSEIFSFNTPRC